MAGPQSYVVATGLMRSSIVGGADGEDVSLHMVNLNPISNQGPSYGGSTNSDQSIHSSGNQSDQRVQIEDALNYLDEVKYQFGNQPQVYNDFLDIMREFKSQSIDTPGVIALVSNLFRDHPELIVGFNIFLPPGYRIVVQANDQVSLNMNLQGGGYFVTTVQPGIIVPGSPGHPAGPPASTIIHSVPGPPIRASVIQPPQTTQQPVFENPTVVNNGSISPVPPPSNLASVTNSYETGTTSTFTHPFSSAFAQSEFPSLRSHPLEFNHAINYIGKIKNRFLAQPDTYTQFLDILQTYQNEQRNIKEDLSRSSLPLTEHEVYSQIAILFENQEDLVQEFSQFLTDSTNQITVDIKTAINQEKESSEMTREFPVITTTAAPIPPKPVEPSPPTTIPKRPALQPVATSSKKMKRSSSFKDISLSEAGKYGTLNEFAFFDKVRQSLKGQDIYDNFLKCLSLYNEGVISRIELIQLVAPFLSKLPELYAWFKNFLGHNETATVPQYETIPQGAARSKKLTEEQCIEIDFSTCKRLGASYCALPKNNIPSKCSGRTSLNQEVLNDVWVSFPTWSEDSTSITARKNPFEGYMYRCEDERFELDVAIETNASTIRVLEAVAKKMSRMSAKELEDFNLDQCLGGTSPTIHQRAVKRLYGEKSAEIIEGLKSHPVVAVPLVLRRLKQKEEEWREAQKGFNKIWREQAECFYLKSLDHQGITFKQSDSKSLRSKSLINEIETLFDERHEQQSNEIEPENAPGGPHISLLYRNREILDDACSLLLHQVRRQSTIGKDDKRKIKQLLKHFVSDLFHHPRIDLSDDENDEDSPDEIDSRKSPSENLQNGSRNENHRNGTSKRNKNGSKQGTSSYFRKNHDLCFDSNASNAVDASTNFGYTQRAPGESQESRRTLAKRESKHLSENNRFRNEMMETERNTEDFSSRAAAKDVSSSMRNRRDCVESEFERYLTSKMYQIENHDLDEQYTLFYVNNCWYVFLRLHQILCERLTKMLETAVNIMNEEAKEDNKNSAAVNLRLKPKREVDVQEYYPTFLKTVRSLLDGNTDANTYEDTLREMFGIHAYVAYTMDKVVANAVRQLQTLVSDEMCQLCYDLFQKASKQGGTGGYCTTAPQRFGAELSYHKKAEKTFVDDNCIKVVIYHKQCRMAMELMEDDAPSSLNRQDPLDQRAKFSSYFERFVNPGDVVSDDLRRELCQKPIFLPRNIRNWKRTREHPYLNETRNKIVHRMLEDHSLTSNDESRLEENIEPKSDTMHNIVDTIEVDSSIHRDKPGSSNKQDPSSNGDSDNSGIKPVMDVEEMERVILSKFQRRRAANDIMLEDSLQCQFNPTSFKMVYVVNSENFIYLKGSLRRARETRKKVSKRLDTAFSSWHQRWLEENVPKINLECVQTF